MICNGYSLHKVYELSFDSSKDRRISRMACQKVAVDAVGPIPRTTKGEITDAALNKYKETFAGFCDWLIQDVENAGEVTTASPETAKMTPVDKEPPEVPVDVPEYSLDDALALTDKVKKACSDNPSLKQGVKLKLVALGVGNASSLDDAITSLTAAKAIELEKFIDKEN